MPSHTVRVLCEARSQSRSVRDAATGEVPFFWRGSSVVMQLGLTDNGQHLLRAGVGTIIVEVKALDATSADDSLMRKEYAAADCDATFLAADWAGGAKQLLAAAFTLAEAAILPGTYRLIVRHVAPDSTEMTYLSTELRVLDPQSGSEGIDAPPVAWSYLEALPVVRADVNQSLTAAQKARVLRNLDLTQPLALNEHRLQWFWKHFFALASAADPSGKYLVVGGYGDSIAERGTGPVQPFYDDLVSRFGVGAILSTPFALGLNVQPQGAFWVTLAGSATLVTANFQYLPNGAYYNIPAGGSVTEDLTTIGRRTGFKKLRCFYARRSGGGTITFTPTQAGATIAAKNANTGTGTAGSIGYVDFEAADGLLENNKISLAVTSASAASHYLGSILFLQSGVIQITLSEGGHSLAQQAVYPRQNLIDLAAATGLSLITHAFKEEDPDGSDLLDHVTEITADLPQVSHLFLGQAPSATESIDISLTTILRDKCEELGLAFFDQYLALRSYAETNALDWEGDGVHLSDDARRYLGSLINHLFTRSMPLVGTRHDLVTRADLADDFLVRHTWRHAGIFSYVTGTSGSGGNWTTDFVAGSTGVYANSGSGPVADTGWGARIMQRARFRGNFDVRFRWTQAENLPSGAHSGIAFGVTAASALTLAEQGLWVQVHGGSAPFIRILLHDGTNLYTSPDFPLPLAPGISQGYTALAGDDPFHHFGVHYVSNGASTAKEVIVYMAPGRPNNAATRPFRPYKVVHWRQTVSNGSSFPAGSTNMVCFRVNAGSSLGSSSFPSAGLLEFAADWNLDTDAAALPWNKF